MDKPSKRFDAIDWLLMAAIVGLSAFTAARPLFTKQHVFPKGKHAPTRTFEL
jgi:hypothetical protein